MMIDNFIFGMIGLLFGILICLIYFESIEKDLKVYPKSDTINYYILKGECK